MTARRTPSAWWLLAAPAACAGILGLSEPVLFVWLLVGLVIGWALVASWKWFVWQERAVAAESDLMFAPAPATTRPSPSLIEDDELTALMRATEERR